MQDAQVIDDVVDDVAEEIPGDQVDPPQDEQEPTQEEASELVITIEGEEQASEDDGIEVPADAPKWAKELRQKQRELVKENKRLKQATEAKQTQEQEITVGPRPTLEGCEFDDERYVSEVEEWVKRKAKAEAKATEAKTKAEAEQKAWHERLAQFESMKTELTVPDYAEAEESVQDVLSVTQQAIIVKGAKNPAQLVYALGKNPGVLKKLAAIQDPVLFAFEAAEIMTKIKTEKRPAPPAPERRVSSGAAIPKSANETMDKLIEEAARTGDISKVREHRKKLAALQNKR